MKPMRKRGCDLGLSTEEHIQQARISKSEIEKMGREAVATARAGQCESALDKYRALAWWVGVVDCHERSAATPSSVDHKFWHAAHEAIRNNCLRPPRVRRR